MSFKAKLDKVAEVLNKPVAHFVFLAILVILFIIDVRSQNVISAFIDVVLAYFSIEHLKKYFSVKVTGSVIKEE